MFECLEGSRPGRLENPDLKAVRTGDIEIIRNFSGLQLLISHFLLIFVFAVSSSEMTDEVTGI